MNNAITQLQLTNFTKIRDLTIDFSPKINIIIGENGTGKTHLLKASYALAVAASIDQKVAVAARSEQKVEHLRSLFKPIDGELGRLVRRPLKGQRFAQLIASFPAGAIEVKIPHKQGGTVSGGETKAQKLSGTPIFIPTKEVLSLLEGMTDPKSDRDTLDRLFDKTYFDLCDQLIKDPVVNEAKAIEQDPRFGSVYEKLADAIDGKFAFASGGVVFYPGEYEEGFKEDPRREVNNTDPEKYTYSDTKVSKFVTRTGEAVSAHMTAEGMRKLGVIQRLVSNRSLSPGASGPLIWDEPETNMNPKLLRRVVEVLLELSRNGQQVILATHDYVLLKWFDLLADKGKGDHVRYHALYRSENSTELNVESVDSYHLLDQNAISNVFAELYDAEIDRSLGTKK